MHRPKQFLLYFMPKDQTEFYKTKDLAEASTLIVKGQQLSTIEREGRVCWFVFINKKGCEELSNNYYFGEVLVNARNFHEVMSRLKGRIFAKE